MKSRRRLFPLFIGCGLGASVAMYVYRNEKLVKIRADRLDRLEIDCPDYAPRIKSDDTKTQDELKSPIVIQGLLKAWPASASWSFSSLRKRIGQCAVDCGSASSDSSLPFYLIAYNATQLAKGRQDLGLYVFDSDFSVEKGKSSLLDDFTSLPTLHRDDVFRNGKACCNSDRPTSRWLLAGPPGSSTILHQDPFHYSSWNASVVGRKRWVLFPPDTPFDILHPPDWNKQANLPTQLFHALLMYVFNMKAIPMEATVFMDEVLPTLRNKGLGEVEIMQHPGEVVAFPAGWWHAVVNIDATIAVTESFGKRRDIAEILQDLRTSGLNDYAGLLEEAIPDVKSTPPHSQLEKNE